MKNSQARQQGVRRHSSNDFDALVGELGTILDRRDRRAAQVRANAALVKRVAGRTSAGETFAKAAASMDAMFKSQCVKPILMVRRAANPASTIAKAFHTLQNDRTLNANQRGRLMMCLASLSDGVAFAKSHPMIDDVHDIRAKLDAALASGHAGHAAPVVREALALIGRGRITPADHMRLSLLLNEIAHKLETENAQKNG